MLYHVAAFTCFYSFRAFPICILANFVESVVTSSELGNNPH